MAADRFTMGDISVAYALLLARNLGLDAQFMPGVAAYWERVSARDGYKRAFARQIEAAKAAGLRAAM
jgi:glutathione S-transferase